MSKNYSKFKTGHIASDAFFKTRPIWFDSDMVISFVAGSVGGILTTLFVVFIV